jgi:hypothetical protein
LNTRLKIVKEWRNVQGLLGVIDYDWEFHTKDRALGIVIRV